MKSIQWALFGATFLVGASVFSAANAADVYARGGSLKDTGPVDYRPAISWTGFYLGANIGSTFDHKNDVSFDSAVSEARAGGTYDIDDTWLAGVHLGYNWQTSRNIVLGIEGDVSGAFDDNDDFDWLGSIRGRVGYAFGNALLYGTAGVAFASTDDDTVTGWVVGGGLDYKLRQNISVGLEGLYYRFDDVDFAGTVPVDFGPGSFDDHFWTVRARLTYHFGGDHYGEPLK